MPQAYFARKPYMVYELHNPGHYRLEHPYQVAATVYLSRIDYENFAEGLDVERQYIEDNAHLCSEGDVYRCILVKRRFHRRGILVVPEEGGFVKLAACHCPKLHLRRQR